MESENLNYEYLPIGKEKAGFRVFSSQSRK